VVRKGLGRAIVFLQGIDGAPYRDIILKAATHDLRYDRQVESLRSRYAVDLMRASGEEAYCRNAVLTALANPAEDESEDLMVEIACLWAEQGDAEARQAVYDAFERHAADDSFVGVEEIIRLDGISGLVRAVHTLTAVDWKEDAWLLSLIIEDVLEARMGKEEAWRALDGAAQNDERVAQALEHVRELRRDRAERSARPYTPQPPISYDALTALLDADGIPPRGPLRRWGRYAAKSDVRRAANALLAETDPARALAYLRVFQARPFPLDPAPIIALADSEDWDMAQAALLVLENMRHPAVRAYALRAIRDPRKASSAVDMLALNFEQGDHTLIEWLAEQPEADEDEEHWRGLGITKFVKQHEGPENARILTLTYDKGACSPCREWLVGDLIDMDALTDVIREECRWDANLDLRAMMAEETADDA
jgi:hypothetical protein